MLSFINNIKMYAYSKGSFLVTNNFQRLCYSTIKLTSDNYPQIKRNESFKKINSDDLAYFQSISLLLDI